MKRDLLFVAERLTNLLDENRLAMLARQHGIRQKRMMEAWQRRSSPFFAAPTRALLAVPWSRPSSCSPLSRGDASHVLREAATAYKVDTHAIVAKGKSRRSLLRKSRQRP